MRGHAQIPTRKDVRAECWHDMLPFLQLSSVSGIDSKLGLTMVRPSLHLVLTSDNPDLWLFQLKIGTPLNHALGKVYTSFIFSTFSFCFEVRAHTKQTDRQTDRRMDGRTEREFMGKTRNAAYIGRPHNKSFGVKRVLSSELLNS